MAGGAAAGGARRSEALAGRTFSLASSPGWTREYVIDPYDDVNGVGLLYFASYPKIADRCERLFAHEQGLLGDADTSLQ